MKMKKPKLELARPSKRVAAVVANGKKSAAAEAIEAGEARLVINVPIELHRRVKIRATERGLTMREYVLSLLREDGLQ
jgi:predicted DNA binding CopG/RHH family protein